MGRRSHAQLNDEDEAIPAAAKSPPMPDQDEAPPSKRTRTRTTTSTSPATSSHAHSTPTPSHTPLSHLVKPASDPSLSSPSSLPSLSLSSFDCSPTLSILPDYFHHHHSLVTQHATALSTHLQRTISRTSQLTTALQHTLHQLDSSDDSVRRVQSQLRAEKRKSERRLKVLTDEMEERMRRLADEKQHELETATADKGREVDRLKRELAKERKERKEVEEREKTSDGKRTEQYKALERKLTIADKKNKRYEETDEKLHATVLQLQQQLTNLAATSSASTAARASTAASSSSSTLPSVSVPHEVQALQRQVDSLQVRLSYYESGPSSLPTLSNRDLSLLAASLQQHLDAVKEEEQARKECKVCMTDSASVVFVPCGHMICCVRCAEGCSDCPVCRVRIDKRIQTKT